VPFHASRFHDAARCETIAGLRIVGLSIARSKISKTGFGRRVVTAIHGERFVATMLSEREVLERVAAAAFEIPRTRFENWRERALIPPTERRRGLGRGMGREAFFYPERTVEQVVEIARLREQNLDLDEIGWRFWLCSSAAERNFTTWTQWRNCS
jgi:hypothetical protein